MNAAEHRNVAASIQNTDASWRSNSAPTGNAATIANNAAPIGIVPYDVPSTSPFASGRSSSDTSRGIDASRAGRNTRLADLDENAQM